MEHLKSINKPILPFGGCSHTLAKSETIVSPKVFIYGRPSYSQQAPITSLERDGIDPNQLGKTDANHLNGSEPRISQRDFLEQKGGYYI